MSHIIWGPLVIGLLLGTFVGFAMSKEQNKPKAIMAALLLAGMWAAVVLVGGSVLGDYSIPALLFFAGTSIASVGTILLPNTNPVKAFFRRAFE